MLSLSPITERQAGDVIRMISGDDPAYRKYFSGLPDDEMEFASSVRDARHDVFWGIWKSSSELSGLVMLRGLDAGFVAPAFGVYVRKADSGKGLARLAMQHAICHCRLHDVSEIVLTVDDGNLTARGLYERMGFARTGEFSPKGQPIYRKKI